MQQWTQMIPGLEEEGRNSKQVHKKQEHFKCHQEKRKWHCLGCEEKAAWGLVFGLKLECPAESGLAQMCSDCCRHSGPECPQCRQLIIPKTRLPRTCVQKLMESKSSKWRTEVPRQPSCELGTEGSAACGGRPQGCSLLWKALKDASLPRAWAVSQWPLYLRALSTLAFCFSRTGYSSHSLLPDTLQAITSLFCSMRHQRGAAMVGVSCAEKRGALPGSLKQHLWFLSGEATLENMEEKGSQCLLYHCNALVFGLFDHFPHGGHFHVTGVHPFAFQIKRQQHRQNTCWFCLTAPYTALTICICTALGLNKVGLKCFYKGWQSISLHFLMNLSP